MKTVNLYQFYSLGTVLHPLQSVQEKDVLKNVYYKLFMAKDWLETVCNDGLIPMIVCRPTAWKLLNAINAVTEPSEGKELDFNKTISFLEAYNITNSLTEFETVFSAELQTLASYFVSQKLIYSTTDLIERPENLFPEMVRKALPRQCIADIRQAGKCIAFDIPTAAAFHILRGTESVIRAYYTFVIGHPPKAKLRNWGSYILNLNTAGADKKITAFLEHIREEYRNPILHPEEMLSSDDAVVLLGAACSAIVQMVLAMSQANPSQPAQPGLSAALAQVAKKP
ncbi:MAG: hypothetical protein WAO02_16775 [Verrucomicrobiia bacterium]